MKRRLKQDRGITTGGAKNYENDISAEKASESKGSWLQSQNGYKVRQKGSCVKTRKRQKDSYNFREII
jgi:hypothetical protein